MTTLGQDLRSALRQARRAPGVTAHIVFSIALGIATCTVIFCLIWALALRPLPFRAPRELLGIRSWSAPRPSEPEPMNRLSLLDYGDLRAQSRSFAGVAAFYENYSLTLTGGEPERVKGAMVSAGLFELLGVRPLRGRLIREEEDRAGAEPVILLGYGLWQRRFGGDPEIIGKAMQANASSYRVAGVMPPGFAFPNESEAWIALGPEAHHYQGRSVRRFQVMARLRPGASAASADRELGALGKRMAALYPAEAGWTIKAVPLRRYLLDEDLQRTFLAALAAVLSVLLIACANISLLLLAQGMKRRRETALHAALGAGPWRIARRLLTESSALAGLGGLLGLPLGIGGLHLVAGALPRLPYGFALTPDPPALAAAFAVSLAAGLLFGIAPALHASRSGLGAAFRPAVGPGRGSQRLHAVLVVTEVALSAVLLIAACLSIRTLSALRSEGRGKAPDHLLTVWTSVAESAATPEEKAGRLQTIVERLTAQSGVESAVATNFVPFAVINGLTGRLTPDTGEAAAPGTPGKEDALCSTVTAGFFRTWGTPLVAGRDLTAAEGAARSSAAVVTESLAHRLWPHGQAAQAVGKHFRIDGASVPVRLTVVGVARDFKMGNLREEARSQVFVAAAHNPFRAVAFVVRTHLPSQEALAAVRRAVHGVDPELPLYGAFTMEEISAIHLRAERLSSGSLTLFGAVALLFAATGTYALLAAGVARQRREIAVRLALGAPRGVLLRRLIGRGMALALAGLALGLLAGLAVCRALAGSLYGVTPTDPVSYAGVAILLLDVAFIACWLPARKALEIEPAEVLREG